MQFLGSLFSIFFHYERKCVHFSLFKAFFAFLLLIFSIYDIGISKPTLTKCWNLHFLSFPLNTLPLWEKMRSFLSFQSLLWPNMKNFHFSIFLISNSFRCERKLVFFKTSFNRAIKILHFPSILSQFNGKINAHLIICWKISLKSIFSSTIFHEKFIVDLSKWLPPTKKSFSTKQFFSFFPESNQIIPKKIAHREIYQMFLYIHYSNY